jgi:mannonate dehydratase
VFDWTRSQLDYRLDDGSTCLIYDENDVEKMNPLSGELSLPGWDSSYTIFLFGYWNDFLNKVV